MDGTIFVFAIILLFVILAVWVSVSERNQLRRYKKIKVGMTEAEMLKIMGNGYDYDTLKDHRKKFEWRVNGSSQHTFRNGIGGSAYSGVRTVTIYTKYGMVEEIKSHNVQ